MNARLLWVLPLFVCMSLLAVACAVSPTSGGDVAITPTTPCPDGGACEGARAIGAVQGDTDASAAIMATGSGPDWLSIRVREDNSSWTGQPLRATLTLDSPADTDYNLFVYGYLATDAGQADGANFAVDCADLVGSSTLGRGQQDRVDLTWGEQAGATPNGLDDGRTLSIAVRSASSTCSSAAWTLRVTGNP